MATTERAAGKAWIAFEELTVDTSAYADGDLIGGKITIDPPSPSGIGNGVLIQSIIITDLAAQAANLEVVFFDGDPANTTFTDNDPFDPADADLEDFCVAVVPITDWHSFADNAVGRAAQLALPIVPVTAGTFYAAIVARGAPTYGASDLGIRFNMLSL